MRNWSRNWKWVRVITKALIWRTNRWKQKEPWTQLQCLAASQSRWTKQNPKYLRTSILSIKYSCRFKTSKGRLIEYRISKRILVVIWSILNTLWLSIKRRKSKTVMKRILKMSKPLRKRLLINLTYRTSKCLFKCKGKPISLDKMVWFKSNHLPSPKDEVESPIQNIRTPLVCLQNKKYSFKANSILITCTYHNKRSILITKDQVLK